MRKTSQDGGDATSATSGVENEIKKPKPGLLLEFKSKKLGKRTVPNLSEESDDGVVEPLLQKTTDKTIQSAKYLAKAKADTVKEISKLFNDKKSQYASTSGASEPLLSEKDQGASKPNVSTNAPLHNYMNTNIFHSHDNSKANGTTKSQLLVEIEGSKQSEYNPSPLIFTTAKIHTGGKSNHMEPVQMTPAPILSTVEVSVSKSGSITTNEKKVSNGTSIINTLYSQPHVNEKTNTVNISNSNVSPVTQSKDNIIANKTCNPINKLFTTNANNSPEILSQINEKAKESTANTVHSKITSVAQNVCDKNANPSKSFTTLPNNPLEIRSPPATSKQMTPVVIENQTSFTRDTKDTKKLIDEPRILMSESKLKSTISDNSKTELSVKTTKSPLQQTCVLESSIKQTEVSQSNKNEKVIPEKNSSGFENDTKIKKIDIKDSQPLQNKNVQPPKVPKELAIKSNIKLTKPLQQKNTKALVGALKTETKTDSSSSKSSECVYDQSAKTLSSSMKTPTQSKVIDSKLSKEIDKSPKPSANEITKTKPKISLNNAAASSTNKLPTSASITKPASKVISSTVTDTSSNSLLTRSNSKAITTTSSISSSSSGGLITPSTSTKTAISTVNTKPTSVTSTKSTKASAASSIKSPQIISTPTSAIKQLNTSTSRTVSGKPSHASTKTPQVNTSSPVTSPTAKTVSKIAQLVSTSHSTGNTSTSSTATAEASNKPKATESNKKDGLKPSGHTKDTKISNA